jgi:hypothetical protein
MYSNSQNLNARRPRSPECKKDIIARNGKVKQMKYRGIDAIIEMMPEKKTFKGTLNIEGYKISFYADDYCAFEFKFKKE